MGWMQSSIPTDKNVLLRIHVYENTHLLELLILWLLNKITELHMLDIFIQFVAF